MTCPTPFTKLDRKEGRYLAFPCGSCPDCRKRVANGWAFRLQMELFRCEQAHFMTFTYEDDKLPLTKYNNFPTLSKRDFQTFMKRLRFSHSGKPIKYFACGEYDPHKRPHYHAIIYNADPLAISKSWGKGFVYRGDVELASIHYTLKYMLKGRFERENELDNREPEFRLMSKGLGENYVTQDSIEWHNAKIEDRYYLMPHANERVAMPRYYRERLYQGKSAEILTAHLTEQITMDEPITPKMREDMVRKNITKIERLKNA